jgi:hypothetical protein
MKIVIVGAVGLLLGLFLGGFGPRAELRRAQRELAEAKEVALRASAEGLLPMALGLGALGGAAGPGGAPGEQGRPVPRFQVQQGASDEPPRDRRDRPDGGARRRRFGLDAQGFAAAKAAADLRSAQFRSAFVEAARLPPEKQQALEQLVRQMNGELAKAADELAESLRARGRKLSPRDFADVGARVLDIYRRHDDRFKASLDDAGKAALGPTDFDLFTQFDVGGFQRLAETAEALGVPGQGRR